MHKKGNMILATIIIVAILISLAFTVYILKANVIDPFNEDVQDSNDYGDTAKIISSQTSANYSTQWDWVIVIFFVASWVSSMLLGRDLDTNLVYFSVAIILLIIVIIVGLTLELSYEDMIADEDYIGIELSFPMTHFIISNLIYIIPVVGLSIGVVLYAKP